MRATAASGRFMIHASLATAALCNRASAAVLLRLVEYPSRKASLLKFYFKFPIWVDHGLILQATGGASALEDTAPQVRFSG